MNVEPRGILPASPDARLLQGGPVRNTPEHTVSTVCTVGVKIKFPFSFRSTELKRYTVLTKNSYKTNKHL